VAMENAFQCMSPSERYAAIKNLCATEPIVLAVDRLGFDHAPKMEITVLYLAKALAETRANLLEYISKSAAPLREIQ
jgi:hypothetical protein